MVCVYRMTTLIQLTNTEVGPYRNWHLFFPLVPVFALLILPIPPRLPPRHFQRRDIPDGAVMAGVDLHSCRASVVS